MEFGRVHHVFKLVGTNCFSSSGISGSFAPNRPVPVRSIRDRLIDPKLNRAIITTKKLS